MLFDEPTSMLDPELVGDVLATIRRLALDGMTMILVTHEMMFAKEVANTVVVMADGRIAEMGPARQVLSAPKTERARSFLERVLPHTDGGGVTDVRTHPQDQGGPIAGPIDSIGGSALWSREADEEELL